MNKKLIGSLTALALLTGAVSAHEVKADDIISGATYKITAKHSGKVLDVARGATNAGANVQQWDDTNGTNQKWTVVDTGDGYYKLVSVNSGKVLDVSSAATYDGANVQQWDDTNGTCQKWKIVDNGDGSYKLVSAVSGKVLDVARGAKNAGANVQQWSDTNGTNQKWEFTKVNDGGNTNPSDTTPTTTTGFHTSGTTLYDAKGNPFIMRGINHAYSWYPGYEDTAIPAIARTGANCVRLVITDGQQYNKTSLSEIQKLIQLCKDNKLIAIVEVHDATGSDNIQDLQKAADFWIEMKSALIGNEANVILNIANEWGGAWDSANWAAGYQQVIPKLRNAGIKNTLMVDCAGWGQYPQSIAEAGQSVVQADSQHNIMFSIHMYEYAGAYGAVQSNIDSALNVGVPLCIGEFGIKHTNGPVDYKTIMSYSQSKGVGYLGWSWKGNGDTWAYLDIAQDWGGSQLSEQGKAIIYDQNGIKNTSKSCSIFD
ncbi:cellulase family glycosylhydrolase [Streptococcus equinus]|uniref:cellulase family glycosylhydrolase n=1 Tax=Streptococcus equinus TaxID=1335 RepID=UPI00088A21CB|nr:cellulase family glycosylhydrolase [Streptococcus equinus]SDQ50293.1 mannan endo-1,4-beta-mannosidase [Streptococcus equinus]SEN84964.1 mannan endo-1,4-beta-mannosidase [Streptococcus equinus]